MTKVFISQPMKDKTNQEIEQERKEIIEKAKKCLGEIEVIDSFFKDAPHDAKPLWFLGKSLELLSTADVIVLGKGNWVWWYPYKDGVPFLFGMGGRFNGKFHPGSTKHKNFIKDKCVNLCLKYIVDKYKGELK